ncbi:MAG: hypothetical protein GF401_08330 [Chitinivibrionales bacterium]|nr:hypothetical protein [Chitinivibrionales bacterium]
MKIFEIIWPQDRIDHIAEHGITPDEVEEACFDLPMVLRGKTQGENPVYYVLGETDAGRYLFCVIISFPDGNGYPVTARDMTKNEKQRYKKWRKI